MSYFDDYAQELPRTRAIHVSAATDTGRHLAPELRLMSLVLGCSTNKELCARFAQVNPLTLFIPQNIYFPIGETLCLPSKVD